jgi:hypothetical protein
MALWNETLLFILFLELDIRGFNSKEKNKLYEIITQTFTEL